MKYKRAILGGTFDHFHRGHKHFIDAAFKESENVTIGLSTEKLFKDKFLTDEIEKYDVRKKKLERYLKEKNYITRAKIVRIQDFFGETLDDQEAEVLFITEHGVENAQRINQERRKRGLRPLKINIVEHLHADDGRIISSSRIRKGEIDREGVSYLNLFKEDLNLPEEMRDQVKVLGDVIPGSPALVDKFHKHFRIAVGDVVAANLMSAKVIPEIAIVDFKSERKPHTGHTFDVTFETHNPAGTIATEAVRATKAAIDENLNTNQPHVIKVEGEEDLLAIPAILLAPLGAHILYGLPPNKGIVVVDATEEKKAEIASMVKSLYKLTI